MKDERKYIVVDQDQRPMTFYDYGDDSQFCYVPPIRHGGRDAVHTYTKREAQRLIKLTIANRSRKGYEILEYYLMRIKP